MSRPVPCYTREALARQAVLGEGAHTILAECGMRHGMELCPTSNYSCSKLLDEVTLLLNSRGLSVRTIVSTKVVELMTYGATRGTVDYDAMDASQRGPPPASSFPDLRAQFRKRKNMDSGLRDVIYSELPPMIPESNTKGPWQGCGGDCCGNAPPGRIDRARTERSVIMVPRDVTKFSGALERHLGLSGRASSISPAALDENALIVEDCVPSLRADVAGDVTVYPYVESKNLTVRPDLQFGSWDDRLATNARISIVSDDGTLTYASGSAWHRDPLIAGRAATCALLRAVIGFV